MVRILRMPPARSPADVLTPNHSLYARQSTASLQELRRELTAHYAQCGVDLDGGLVAPGSCDWERQYYQNRIDYIDRILRRRSTGLGP